MMKQRKKLSEHGQVYHLLLFVVFKFHVGLCAGGLQIGGGITDENAAEWLIAGASQASISRRRCCFIS
jgi:hypothetical protein